MLENWYLNDFLHRASVVATIFGTAVHVELFVDHLINIVATRTNASLPTISISDIQYVKIFDGECDGSELFMYDDGENPGRTIEEQVAWCSASCREKKKPKSGSWAEFGAAEGFIVIPTGTHKGRCYCESKTSVECKRDVESSYDRYDWRKIGRWYTRN